MFIATATVGCIKLRRSGMPGAGDVGDSDLDPAAPTELGWRSEAVAAIDIALLTELSRLWRSLPNPRKLLDPM